MDMITLSFTPEEYRDLAKRIEISRFFFDLDPDFDIMDVCDDEDAHLARKIMADHTPELQPVGLRIYNMICRIGIERLPDSGDFEPSLINDDSVYSTGDALQEECCDRLENFEADIGMDILPSLFAQRDYKEKYGYASLDMEIEDFPPGKLDEFCAITDKYRKEIDIYGITHFYLKTNEVAQDNQ